MEKNSEYARRLKSFDRVWQRVKRSKGIREAAEERGMRLMPRGKPRAAVDKRGMRRV